MPRPPKLPARKIAFHPHRQHSFDAWCRVIAYRQPNAGEFYLSGAIIEAWEAVTDYPQNYWIVEAIFPNTNLHEYPHEFTQGESS